MARPRVMIPWQSGTFVTSTHQLSIRIVRMALEHWGYEPVIVNVEEGSTIPSTVTTDDYAFCVVDQLLGGESWDAGDTIAECWDGTMAIPTFCLGVTGNSNQDLRDTTGCGDHGSGDSAATKKCYWLGSSDNGGLGTLIYARGAGYTVASGQEANVVPIIRTALGNLKAWRYTAGAGAYVYCDNSNMGSEDTLFPVLLAQAVADGAIDPPPRKILTVVDLDDMPDTLNTLGDMQEVVRIAGIGNWPIALGLRPADWPSIASDIKALIASNQVSRGGWIYPLIHRASNWDTLTKTAADTQFRADAALFAADGVYCGESSPYLDSFGYMYFNGNRFDDETLQLGSPETSLLSSPANDEEIAGYGWKVVRSDSGTTSNTGIGEPSDQAFAARDIRRGIRVVGSKSRLSTSDLAYTIDSATEISNFSNLTRDLMVNGLSMLPTYFHGSNCYIGHDSGNAPALRFLANSYAPLVRRLDLLGVMRFARGAELADR